MKYIFTSFFLVLSIALAAQQTGELDATFGVAGIVNATNFGSGNAVAIQSDNKILVTAGNFGVARYSQNGGIDNTFSADGVTVINIGASDLVNDIAVQVDGKIVLAGYSESNGNLKDFAIVRLNTDGSLDTTFNSTGILTFAFGAQEDQAKSIAIQADGKIIVVGFSFTGLNRDFAIARINNNGTLDNTFSDDGKLTLDVSNGNDNGNGVAVTSAGSIYAVTTSFLNTGSNSQVGVIKLTPTGTLDLTFNSTGVKTLKIGTGSDNGEAIAVQNDGKIVIAGNASTTISGSQLFSAFRINANGDLDPNFSNGGKFTTGFGGNSFGKSLVIQLDGALLIGGYNTSVGTSQFGIIRLTSFGFLDSSFSGDGKNFLTINGSVGADLGIQKTGRIIQIGYNSTGLIMARFVTNQFCGNTLSGFNTVSTTFNSATVNWNSGANIPYSFDYYYRNNFDNLSNFSPPPSGNISASSNNTLTITSLLPLTEYYYWIRPNCGDTNGGWTFGGNFTTAAFTGCTNGVLNPVLNFQPSCNGSYETINQFARTGEYSNITISPEKSYAFKSDVATDYITVTNDTGNIVYAKGLTPLNWYSDTVSGTLRYYLHSNNQCGIDDYTRLKSVKCSANNCINPTSLMVTNITATSVNLNWVVAITPLLGFEYFYNNTNTPPALNTVPSGTTINLNATVTGLSFNSTFYFWVRSKCFSNDLNSWVAGGSFTTTDFGGCTVGYNGGPLIGTNVPCTDNFELLGSVTTGVNGGFRKVNLTSNRNYTFKTDVDTDYITISNDVNNQVLVYGLAPVSWNSASFSGTARFYASSNANCGSGTNVFRTTFVKCSTTFCTDPTSLTESNITNVSLKLNWACSSIPANGFEYLINTQNFSPNYNTNVTGSTSSLSVTINGLNANSTYYYWVRSICSSASVGGWVYGGSFTTNTFAGCNNGVLFPSNTFTPVCSGSVENITTNALTGQFSKINILANKSYIFSSSVSPDYITITDELGINTLAQGYSPLTWTSSVNNVIRYYVHTNISCGTDSVSRSKFISCLNNCIAPINFHAWGISNTGVRLSWIASDNANNFDIYYSTNNIIPVNSTIPTQSNLSGFDTTLTGLNSSSTYYYWIRTSCGSNLYSDWYYGGIFKTDDSICTGEILWPTNAFIPSCSGLPEIITTAAFAGDYTLVNVIPNKTYTFSSSVPTDYIKINFSQDGFGSVVWNSGQYSGPLKFYLYSSSSCGFSNVTRTRSITCSNTICEEPINVSLSEFSTTSLLVKYSNATINSNNAIEYYVSTSNTPPIATTLITGIDSNTNLLSNYDFVLTPNNVAQGVAYYVWIRRSCGINEKSEWVFAGNSAVLSNVGCTNGSYYPPVVVYTPLYTGFNEIVNTNAYHGEYAKVNFLPNKQYTFVTSIATDFVTITNNSGTITYASGSTPLIWNSGSKTGIIRYYIHSNSNCGVGSTNVIRYISCNNSEVCNTASNSVISNFSFTGITRTQGIVNFSGNTNLINFNYFLNTINTAPLITTAPTGTINAGASSFNLTGLNFNTTYYLWIKTDCGFSSAWIYGGSFTTIAGCLNGNLFPTATFTPICSNNLETILTTSKAGDYSNVNISANNQYTFSTSVPSDYITISNTNGTIIYASGTSPLIWNSGNLTGIIRYYIHTNNTLCGVQNTNRIRYIRCTATNCNVSAPTSSNQIFCQGATVSNLVANGQNLKWYDNSVAGNLLNINSILVSGNYYVSQSINNCESLSRTAIVVTVNANVIPIFSAIIPICVGGTLNTLPTISTNGVTGTWSPPLNNSATTTYTFTPTAGQCANVATLQIVVNQNTISTFNAVSPICAGAVLSALPTTSTNGVTGTWSPALNNSATTTYTFTPSAGQCASTATLQIVVNQNIIPTFNAVSPICAGASLSSLPTTSTNGVTGTWSPALNNSSTTTYTFTPSAGQCPSTATLQIVVNQNTIPAFTPITPVCVGASLNALPTNSTNGVTGTWSPALNNSATTTYTFTPSAGQCASTATLQIVVNQNTIPAFTPITPVCVGASLNALPTNSTNGVTGTWSPALNNSATTTYTFTPSAGQCANSATLQIVVNQNTIPTFSAISPICAGDVLTVLPTTSTNGVIGTWSPALNNSATTTYTFTPSAGQCASNTTLQIVVNSNVVVDNLADVITCFSYVLPTLSNGNYYTGLNGTGLQLSSGNIITTSQNIYIYNSNGTCSNQSDFNVLINSVDNSTILQNNTITAVQNNANYQWYTCNPQLQIIPGQTSQSFVATNIGSYSVSVTINNCERMSTCVDIILLSISDLSKQNEILVFPNPNKGLFTVDCQKKTPSKIQVFDSLGRIIVDKTPTVAVENISIKSYESGIYYVKVLIDNKVFTKKIVYIH